MADKKFSGKKKRTRDDIITEAQTGRREKKLSGARLRRMRDGQSTDTSQ